MDSPFVSEDFVVPLRVEQADYRLRPLTVTDVVHDYEAVMSSKESPRRIFCEDNATWPDDTMTQQENYHDLERYQKDFEQRNGFTYSNHSDPSRA